MNQEIKTKWIAALRSGDYKQGMSYLQNNGKYCCLGVLCDLHAIETGNTFKSGSYLGETRILPYEVEKWSGMLNSYGGIETLERTLWQLNDDGEPFSKIADIIEKHF